MGPLEVGELPAVAQASRDLFFFLTRGPEVGIAWWLSSVRARFSALLLPRGLKVAATASAISSPRKKEEAKKRRNSGDSCTHSSVNTLGVFEHNLLDTVVLTGILGHAEQG